MKRKILVGAAVAVSAALALSGCSSSGGSSGSQSAKALTWGMWIAGNADQAAWQKVADSADAGQSGLKVTIQGAPFNDYWTKLRTQLSTGSAPCIVSLQSLRAANYTDQLLPLDSLAKKNKTDLTAYDSTALTGMKVDGKLYALPYDTGPYLMFYNADMFKEAGVAAPKPGWTVSDFEAAGAALKAKGKTLFASTVEDLGLESSVLAYNGGRVISEDGTLDATNPKFEKGLDWLASLVKKGYALPASADGSNDDNEFVSGQAATYSDGPWSLITQKAKAKFTLGVTTLPVGDSTQTTFSAGSGFGISKQCKYPDQAYKAITSMTSEKTLGQLAAAGRAFPGRTAVQKDWFDNAKITGAQDVFDTALKGAVPLPGNKNSDQLGQLFAQYGIQAVNGQQSGEKVMSQISSQLPK
jgi:multiple sugar transport system substrate-binding protein